MVVVCGGYCAAVIPNRYQQGEINDGGILWNPETDPNTCSLPNSKWKHKLKPYSVGISHISRKLKLELQFLAFSIAHQFVVESIDLSSVESAKKIVGKWLEK